MNKPFVSFENSNLFIKCIVIVNFGSENIYIHGPIKGLFEVFLINMNIHIYIVHVAWTFMHTWTFMNTWTLILNIREWTYRYNPDNEIYTNHIFYWWSIPAPRDLHTRITIEVKYQLIKWFFHPKNNARTWRNSIPGTPVVSIISVTPKCK
jgi:hypothetical protein